jgi:hypothetical protein
VERIASIFSAQNPRARNQREQAAAAVTLQTHIQQDPCSNLGQDTGYPV